MEKNSKIFVAGHNGMVGSAIVRRLQKEGYSNLLLRSSSQLDLRNANLVNSFFEEEKPEYIFFAAGTVGGIMANFTYPADFIYNNISMILNTIHAAYANNARKFLYLGSSCIYPKNAPQPIKEEYLLTGTLEDTNRPYAIAKIAGIELCTSYNRQYKTDYVCLMPTNMFGINDNYDLQNSHLVAALIRKFHEAKIENKPSVELWGTGLPKREILYCDELADACFYFMQTYSGNEIINIGKGHDYSILEIANMIKNISNYTGEINFDSTKPDGTMKKQLDVSKARKLGWESKGDMNQHLTETYNDFVKNYSKYTLSEK